MSDVSCGGCCRGPTTPDQETEPTLAILPAVLQPTFFEAIRAGTRSTDEVSTIVTGLITPAPQPNVKQ